MYDPNTDPEMIERQYAYESGALEPFNYEERELSDLKAGPFKIKLYDDNGNSTKWLTLTDDTFSAIREALIRQGAERD